jgi:hypothetical protein
MCTCVWHRASKYVCVSVRVRVHTSPRYVHVHTLIEKRMCVPAYTVHIHIHMLMHAHVSKNICIHSHVHMTVHMTTYDYIWLCTYAGICTWHTRHVDMDCVPGMLPQQEANPISVNLSWKSATPCECEEFVLCWCMYVCMYPYMQNVCTQTMYPWWKLSTCLEYQEFVLCYGWYVCAFMRVCTYICVCYGCMYAYFRLYSCMSTYARANESMQQYVTDRNQHHPYLRNVKHLFSHTVPCSRVCIHWYVHVSDIRNLTLLLCNDLRLPTYPQPLCWNNSQNTSSFIHKCIRKYKTIWSE